MKSPFHRNGLIGALAAVLLAATGCDSVLTTTQLPAVREDGIVGTWKDLGIPGSKPQDDPVVIQAQDSAYVAISPGEQVDEKTSRFTLARVGGVLIEQEQQSCGEFSLPKDQSCWSLSRIELLADRMNFYEFDAARLARESVEGKLTIPHFVRRQRNKDGSFDTTVLLSAEGGDLTHFLEPYVKRSGVFRLTGRLQRVSR